MSDKTEIIQDGTVQGDKVFVNGQWIDSILLPSEIAYLRKNMSQTLSYLKLGLVTKAGRVLEMVLGNLVEVKGNEEYRRMIQKIIFDHLKYGSDCNPELKLHDFYGADSLDIVEIIMEIEMRLNVDIDDSATEKFKTPNDIVKHVINLLEKND